MTIGVYNVVRDRKDETSCGVPAATLGTGTICVTGGYVGDHRRDDHRRCDHRRLMGTMRFTRIMR